MVVAHPVQIAALARWLVQLKVAHSLMTGPRIHSLGEIVVILLVEKRAMSLVGLNMNVPLVGICWGLKMSGLGVTPPGGSGGGAEGCCVRVPVCAGVAESGEGEGGTDAM